MQCGRVQLQERTKLGCKDVSPVTTGKCRRHCHKRLVDYQCEDEARWIDRLDRFHSPVYANTETDSYYFKGSQTTKEDLVLSVQTLQFQGAEQHNMKRPRTSFKYKTMTDKNTHRMFVKQPLAATEQPSEDRSSQLTCYYYEDYAKYLSTTGKSRPSSGTSSLRGVLSKFKENKAVQVDLSKAVKLRKTRNTESKNMTPEIIIKDAIKCDAVLSENQLENSNITFQKSGKHKSLTISRTQSPEMVQVIRVHVVCNYSTSSAPSDCEDGVTLPKAVNKTLDKTEPEDKNIEDSRLANKYLLTNPIKTIEENVSGGAKVTLVCKTFSLINRSKMLFKRKPLDIAKVTGKSKLFK